MGIGHLKIDPAVLKAEITQTNFNFDRDRFLNDTYAFIHILHILTFKRLKMSTLFPFPTFFHELKFASFENGGQFKI